MFPVLVGLGVAGLAGWAGVAVHKRHKRMQMNPQRTQIYTEAMQSLKDPEKLRTLADAFEKEGLKEQADMLRKRANLRALPDDVKAKRRATFKAAMSSPNKKGVLLVAEAHEKEGAMGAAKKLREYAATLPDTPPPETAATK